MSVVNILKLGNPARTVSGIWSRISGGIEPFTHAISLVLSCDTQAEIDRGLGELDRLLCSALDKCTGCGDPPAIPPHLFRTRSASR